MSADPEAMPSATPAPGPRPASPSRRRRQLANLNRGFASELLHNAWVVVCVLVAFRLGLAGIEPLAATVLIVGMPLWAVGYYLVCRHQILTSRHYRPRLAVSVVTLVDSLILLSFIVLDRFSWLSAAIMITSLVLNMVFFAEAMGARGAILRTAALVATYGVAFLLTPSGPRSLSGEQFVLVLLVFAVVGLMMAVVAHNSQAKTRQIVELLARQKEYAEQLSRYNAELEKASLQDGLTGVANRRSFDRMLAGEFGRVERHRIASSSRTASKPQTGRLSLVLLDVDHFKAYNDHLGHLAGDDCLRRVAAAMQGALLRPSDQLARYGGEEFAVVLPETDLDGAKVVAQRVLDAVRQLEIEHPGSSVGPFVTVSAGIAEGPSSEDDQVARLIERADEALYRAKAAGRARVAVSDQRSVA
ncbi:MAG: GGDEF domain-containing protein [Acidobacteria bacterium]|nr:MAG: GGDEF domain-containing protein [Acidobacteriota bacterium]